MTTSFRSSSRLLTQAIIFFVVAIATAATASAGTGKFEPDGNGGGKFNFCVSVRFNGTVNIVNNSLACEEAEYWILPGAGEGNSSVRMAVANTAKPKQDEIVLIYYPPVFRPNPEGSDWVLVTVQPDGHAKVVLFGEYYWSDAVSIYQGKLPQPYLRQLLNQVREALSLNSSFRHYEGGPQDEQVFYLSTLPLTQTFPQRSLAYSGLLGAPRNVTDLIYELRTLWQRLEKVRPAYAYLRVVSVGSVSPQHGKERSEFKQLQTFPRELRPIVLAAIRSPLAFEPLDRPQSVKILSVIPDPSSFNVVIGSRVYRLTLYLPRTKSTSTSRRLPSHAVNLSSL